MKHYTAAGASRTEVVRLYHERKSIAEARAIGAACSLPVLLPYAHIRWRRT